jgi:hypothetical protein
VVSAMSTGDPGRTTIQRETAAAGAAISRCRRQTACDYFEQSAEIILTDVTFRCCALLFIPEALLVPPPVVPVVPAELEVEPDAEPEDEDESTVPVTSTLWPT